jgi:D-alanyl-lipoteichoic acid acyltransferase DltB (MBOAT superfamily)
MSFLSIAFAAWVAVTVIAFHLLPARFRPSVLLISSLAFYATHGLGYLALLVTLTLGTYRSAILIDQAAEPNKRRVLLAAVTGLILILCAFKLGGALALSHRVGEAQEDTVWRFLMPLGLSYYLFKLLSYLLEVYWENLAAQRSPMVVCLYASFFPQIVCGPIERPGPFFEQVGRGGQIEPEDLVAGFRLILFGLFKKIAIADRLGPAVATIHGSPELHSSLELLFGAYAFAIQLYADFSGLTDIALGIGRLFGIKGPENFNLPFFASNLQDYWRRWHMSLTSWLGDYLFTPLRMGLRDLGQFGLAAAVFLNMVAIGVWHGFTGPYLAFGIYHGVALAVSVLTLKRRDQFFKAHPALARVRSFAAPLLTFHLVVLGMILFRAESLQLAVRYLSSMATGLFHSGISPLRFQLGDMPPKLLVSLSILVIFMEIVHVATRNPGWRGRFQVTPRVLRWAMYYGLILVTLSFSRFGEENFIYGQF